jgi:hypothetical protein
VEKKARREVIALSVALSVGVIYCFEASAIAFLLAILLIRRELKRGDDGPPEPPHGDCPHVPDEARR